MAPPFTKILVQTLHDVRSVALFVSMDLQRANVTIILTVDLELDFSNTEVNLWVMQGLPLRKLLRQVGVQRYADVRVPRSQENIILCGSIYDKVRRQEGEKMPPRVSLLPTVVYLQHILWICVQCTSLPMKVALVQLGGSTSLAVVLSMIYSNLLFAYFPHTRPPLIDKNCGFASSQH